MSRRSPHHAILPLGLATAVVGCAPSDREHTAEARGAVIYGEDTRRDVYAEDSAVLRRLARESSVAFIGAEHLARRSDGSLGIVADTLGDANHLCAGEAFVTQPAAATCSGVLVDDQLVLTAGHCVDASLACDDRLLVLDYAITDPARAITLDDDAIYRCKSVVLRRYGVDSAGRHDFAFVELDRPVSADRRPVMLAPEDPPLGSALAVIGYPSGLPVKIDSGAALLGLRSCRDYFTLSSDTFQSSSGSGVFDPLARLVGSFARGSTDYEYVSERGCAVARRVVDVSELTDGEQASSVAPAVEALCAAGWPSPRLCAGIGEATGPDAGACPASSLADGGCAASGDAPSPPGLLLAAIAMRLARRRVRRAGQ